MLLLAWEPSIAQLLLVVTPAVLPHYPENFLLEPFFPLN